MDLLHQGALHRRGRDVVSSLLVLDTSLASWSCPCVGEDTGYNFSLNIKTKLNKLTLLASIHLMS